MESKLTRFGYVIKKNTVEKNILEKLRTELCVKPFKMQSYQKFSKDDSFNVYQEDDEHMIIPRFYGLEKFGEPKKNYLLNKKYPTYDMKYIGSMRPNQEIMVNKVFDGFQKFGGGLLIAGCGCGKTNMAIYIACKYKLKTLFVVHKEFLSNQVRERIISCTNQKKVGTIQGKVVDTDHAFVVGMIQSLSTKDYEDDIFKDFGLIIVDEVHHMGARNFSKFYNKITGKYMLGISAENSRNDGTYRIINWFMGPILHKEEQKPNTMVIVKNFNYYTSNEKRMETLINRATKEADRSRMITNLILIKKRNRFIITLVKELFANNKNVLCLTGRIKQVELFEKLLVRDPDIGDNVGKYLGGMPKSELAKSSTKRIILGTYSMAEEGLDITGLNVVILCTPKSQIKQSVGRILRKDIYDEHPIVIDFSDDNDIFKNQSRKRKNYYKKQKYNIQDFDISDYELTGCINYDDIDKIRECLNKIPENNPESEDEEDLYSCSIYKFID